MRTIRNRRATDSVSLGAVARGLEESASANVGAFLSPVEVRRLVEELKRLRVVEIQDFVRQVKAGDFTATNDAAGNYGWTVRTPLSAS